MNFEEMHKLLAIKNTDLKVHYQQFENWMNKMFYLNRKLHEYFDPVYLHVFYIVVVELNQTGAKYINDFVESNKDSGSQQHYYKNVENGLTHLLDDFTEEERNYILYKRDCSCHIHQNSYEYCLNNKGKIKSDRTINGSKINKTDFQEQSFDVLLKHGSDEQFDSYFLRVLYPRIAGLLEKLKNIKC